MAKAKKVQQPLTDERLPAAAEIRDRVVRLERVRASQLIPHPKNWRRHPSGQANALRGLLGEIGYADALLARETPEGLMLIDGHLRAETTPNMEVPVLVLDVTADEAEKLLLSLDPLAAMAARDEETLRDLLSTVRTDSAWVAQMFAALGNNTLGPPEEPDEEDDQDSSGLESLGDVVIPEPLHEVKRGDHWRIGDLHHLFCADVFTEWAVFVPALTPDALLVPYPTPYVPLATEALKKPLVLVQPDPYACGVMLDLYERHYGSGKVSKA